MTGHNEVVLVVYRPLQIEFEALLKIFWESHNPTQGMRQGNDQGTQYRSGIYYYDDAQRLAAEQSLQGYQQKLEASGLRRLPPKYCRQVRSTMPRITISSTWKKTRLAIVV